MDYFVIEQLCFRRIFLSQINHVPIRDQTTQNNSVTISVSTKKLISGFDKFYILIPVQNSDLDNIPGVYSHKLI